MKSIKCRVTSDNVERNKSQERKTVVGCRQHNSTYVESSHEMKDVRTQDMSIDKRTSACKQYKVSNNFVRTKRGVSVTGRRK